jgi:hypothetical protein
MADENGAQDRGFVLRIRGCKRNITGLRIQNAAQPSASKGFKVFGALEYTGPWINLVEEELIETNATLTFHFNQPSGVQFLRFELLSYNNQKGGGLKFFSPLAECEVLSQPEVVWSTSYTYSHLQGIVAQHYRVEGVFTDGGNHWLTEDKYKGHGFTIKLSSCTVSLVGVRVKNIAHRPGKNPQLPPNRATQSFRISGVLRESGPWEQLLEEEFENPLTAGASAPTLQTIYFKEAVEVQFLRFDLNSYWGDKGGGLAYFGVITVSDMCRSTESDCPPRYCGSPTPMVRKPAGVNCQCSQSCTEPFEFGN